MACKARFPNSVQWHMAHTVFQFEVKSLRHTDTQTHHPQEQNDLSWHAKRATGTVKQRRVHSGVGSE